MKLTEVQPRLTEKEVELEDGTTEVQVVTQRVAIPDGFKKQPNEGYTEVKTPTQP